MIWKAMQMKQQQLQQAGQPAMTVTQLTAHVVTGITTAETQDLFSTPMKVMDIQFVEIQLVSNPILITVRNIIPVKKMAKASFY